MAVPPDPQHPPRTRVNDSYAPAGVLSKEERRMLLRLLKKLGKGGEDEP